MKEKLDYLPAIRQALDAEPDDHRLRDDLRSTLAEAHAADIAEALEHLRDEDRSRVLFALDPHSVAEVVVMLGEATRGEVVEDLDAESLSEIVSELPPDDAADVLGELSDEESDEVLEHLPDEKSVPIEQLLVYGEETAGGIMTPEVVAVPASATVGDAVEYVRDATQEEDLNEVFIVDDQKRLTGTVPLRRLVTNSSDTRLVDICDRDVVSVYATDDQETVLQVIRKYDVLEAAVVDDAERLLGRITHDDLQDVAEEEAAEDLYRMAGTDPAEFERQSILHAARIRLTWLLPCMFGMLITATVLAVSKPQFDVGLYVWLSCFVPMIGAMGGNSGIQISTVIVRAFATRESGATRIVPMFMREGRIALVMAIPCGLLAFSLAYLSLPLYQRLEGGMEDGATIVNSAQIATAVGLAMATAILVAGVLGILLPFLFRRLGVDPAIASGPLVTTLNDVVSVGIYMSIALVILM
ncbi:MAG: magnesium transporter [Planctomycetota bacterium]|jgi:magnesium transporter